MNRRQVMQGITAALAAGLAPELLVGTATAGGLADRLVELEDVPDFLRALDEQVAKMRARVLSGPAARFFRRVGLGPDYLNDVGESLVRVSAFRDLPRRVQAHPEMQRRIRRELPRLGQQVLAMARAMRELPEGTRRQTRRLLRENPELKQVLRTQRRTALAAVGAPVERIQQTDRLLERIYFRLERQHPSMFLDELVEKVRRASDEAGTSEAEWDALIAAELPDLPEDEDRGLILLVDDGDEVTPNPEAVPESSSSLHTGAHRAARALLRIGLVTAGVGGGLFLLGLGTMFLAEGAGMVLTIVGALVVFVGLAILAVALIAAIIAEASDGDAHAEENLRLPDDTLAWIGQGALWWGEPQGVPV